MSETSWDALILSEEVGDSFTENDALGEASTQCK